MGRDSFDPRLICVHDWEDGRVLYVHMHDRSDSLIDACLINGHMHEAQPPSPPDDQMLLINVLLSDSIIAGQLYSTATMALLLSKGEEDHWSRLSFTGQSASHASCNLQRYSRDGRRLINLNRQVAAQGHADTSFRM